MSINLPLKLLALGYLFSHNKIQPREMEWNYHGRINSQYRKQMDL